MERKVTQWKLKKVRNEGKVERDVIKEGKQKQKLGEKGRDREG